jgi:CRP-like cAMP-binding protein
MQETGFLTENIKVLSDMRKFEIFESFQDDELRNLISMSKIRMYNTGEIIFDQGSADTWLYFLIHGRIRLVKDGKIVAVLKDRGDIFGEMGAIVCAPRSASAIAVGKTACLATDIYYIEQLNGNDKLAFGYVSYRVFSNILAERLRTTTNELMKFRNNSIKIW